MTTSPLENLLIALARRRAGAARRTIATLRSRRISTNHVLDPQHGAAAMRAVSTSLTVEEGAVLRVTLILRNHTGRAWSSRGRHPVMLRAMWLDRHGSPLDEPTTTVRLPYALDPGAELAVPIELTAIDALGEFRLRIVVGQDAGLIAGDELASATLHVSVTARTADDMDYLDLYGEADLSVDHWAIVGPQTQAEFDRLGDVKLRQLVAAGLTPSSRLLDVGCGTGLLTVSAERYLDDAGAYVGTDVGPEAIEYCRRTFTRPNFSFVVNGMTTLPLPTPSDPADGFHAACFYSVFTHTYPDETALLLAETRRLLAPGGFVVADWFVSPMVERCAGHREALENNSEHLLRLVGLAGFEADLIETWPWKRFGERRFYRLAPAP